MLIQNLNILKQSLAFKRLFLSEKLEFAKGIKKGFSLYHIAQISAAEGQIIWLQLRLSLLYSHAVGLIGQWDSLEATRKDKWKEEVKAHLRTINVSPLILRFAEENVPLELLDRNFFKQRGITEGLYGYMSFYKEGLRFFTGYPLEERRNEEATASEIRQMIDTLIQTNVNEIGDLEKVVATIGENGVYQWNYAVSPVFLGDEKLN